MNHPPYSASLAIASAFAMGGSAGLPYGAFPMDSLRRIQKPRDIESEEDQATRKVAAEERRQRKAEKKLENARRSAAGSYKCDTTTV
jgi:hypothetical protein